MKRKSLTALLALGLLATAYTGLVAAPALAQANAAQQTAQMVVASGEGASREAALTSALRHAVEQAVGMSAITLISGNGTVN